MKEKIYTFRHYSWAYKINEPPQDEEQFKSMFIENQLKRGYFPVDVKVQKVKANAVNKMGLTIDYSSSEPIKEFIVASAFFAYAGKKQSKKRWEENQRLKTPDVVQIYQLN